MTEDGTTSTRAAAVAPPAPERGSIEAQLADWTQKLDRHLEKADRSVAIGRELVEQRALNIDLQRQIHRLEDELQSLRARIGAGGDQSQGFATSARNGLSTAPPNSARGRLSLSDKFRKIFGH